MKADEKSGAKGPPAPIRLDPEAEALRQAKADALRMNRKNRASLRRTILLGGLAVFAVLAYLEFVKPRPAEIRATLLVTADKVEGPVLPVKAPETTEAPPKEEPFKEPVAPPPAETAATPPPAVPPPAMPRAEEAAVPEPTEAEKLAAEAVMLLAGPDSRRDAAVSRDKDLLERAANGKAWDAYRALLGRSIKAVLPAISSNHGLNRFDPVWNEPVLYRALLRWKTIGCFSESEITAVVTDAYSGGMFLWLLNDTKAMEELLLTISPKDDGAKVLAFLTETRATDEKVFSKYYSLALACAVVFDQPMGIPHPVGDAGRSAEQSVDPVKRFRWYVDNSEKGRLTTPVQHSSARDLVWVVCAPVTTSELDWAIDRVHYSRRNWGNAYGKVEYLMERAVNGLDPYKEYSFSEILKKGGICGDRSYFCVNTARAHGIPAMTMTGETDLGGHAWAGIKVDDREWTTNSGRIGGVSKGKTDNPQTGEPLTEQEIQLWNDRYHQSLVVTLSVWRHLWLADFFSATDNATEFAATVRLANRTGHTFTETWQALYNLLVRQTHITGDPPAPTNLTEWRDFAKDMRREFKDNPRMAELAANAELEYVFPYGPEGDVKRELARDRRRIARDSGEQKDLIATSLKREADLISKRGGPDVKRDISRLYDRGLRDYGGSITGFKMMAEDYFGYFKDDKELARKAAWDIELAFKRVVETGTKEWFRANAESDIYRMICGYYRTAGDDQRADMLEKRFESLLKHAKRGAL